MNALRMYRLAREFAEFLELKTKNEFCEKCSIIVELEFNLELMSHCEIAVHRPTMNAV